MARVSPWRWRLGAVSERFAGKKWAADFVRGPFFFSSLLGIPRRKGHCKSLSLAALLDAIKVAVGAQEQRSIGDGRRRQHAAFQAVPRQQLELWPRPQH